jgi:broad-specificity NMP kinase
MLIIFGGLPGTGKTTISKEVAKRLKAVYLRVDTIEQTLKNLEGYPDSLVIGWVKLQKRGKCELAPYFFLNKCIYLNETQDLSNKKFG